MVWIFDSVSGIFERALPYEHWVLSGWI